MNEVNSVQVKIFTMPSEKGFPWSNVEVGLVDTGNVDFQSLSIAGEQGKD